MIGFRWFYYLWASVPRMLDSFPRWIFAALIPPERCRFLMRMLALSCSDDLPRIVWSDRTAISANAPHGPSYRLSYSTMISHTLLTCIQCFRQAGSPGLGTPVAQCSVMVFFSGPTVTLYWVQEPVQGTVHGARRIGERASIWGPKAAW